MRKLRLDVDGLRVESFDTTAADAAERGTVRGNAAAGPETPNTCNAQCSLDTGCHTYAVTCPVSCGESCDDPSCQGSCIATCLTHCGSCDATCEATCPACFYTYGGCTTAAPEFCNPPK